MGVFNLLHSNNLISTIAVCNYVTFWRLYKMWKMNRYPVNVSLGQFSVYKRIYENRDLKPMK